MQQELRTRRSGTRKWKRDTSQSAGAPPKGPARMRNDEPEYSPPNDLPLITRNHILYMVPGYKREIIDIHNVYPLKDVEIIH